MICKHVKGLKNQQSFVRQTFTASKKIFEKGLANRKKSVFLRRSFERRSVSSVGLERLLDRQEVTGSNPVQITKKKSHTDRCDFFLSFDIPCIQCGSIAGSILQMHRTA